MALYTISARPASTSPFDRRWSSVYHVRPRPELPPEVNLAPWLGPVRNQNIPAIGECSGESGAGAMDWLCRRWRNEAFVGSSLGLYEVERLEVNQLAQDMGARLRQTQYAMQVVGVWANSLDPDIKQDFVVPITDAMLQSAAQHRIREGLWCPTLDEILNALAHPTQPTVVQVGIVVYPSFESNDTLTSGIVPMPGPTEQPLGGHAVLCIGADLKQELLFFRNSWGSCYGAALLDNSHANFALPFRYFDTPRTFLSARAYYL
ncbi:MAG: hypothetical protein C7B45_16650 [Sulfobacillus acidophilus]|uniref:Peptidase C1A papain C-terminal domain-containing protein n=1 Tax=Sulfobacillus acidophilus TaxID=53633 RepID=A0A2T2WCW6_9FIRM|nr:MAG: hypothetical protein C7B45_16650 [Sulfobacillus acidophilus]